MRFDTWAEFLDYQRRQPYMREINEAVKLDRRRGPVYPASEDVFRFTETPLAEVKVVILGQDPYHRRGQADGLAFSVRDPSGCPRCLNHANMQHYCKPNRGAARVVEKAHTPIPPSLKNIFVELRSDLGVAAGDRCLTVPTNGNLTPWTRQGVLLLNTALTVREGEAGSHCDIWQPFTDEVIRAVCDSAAVAPHFILWGAKAKRALERVLGNLIECHWNRKMALQSAMQYDVAGLGRWNPGIAACLITATYSAHPSPKSVNLGFFGSRPFSRANLALTLNNPGCAPVDWRLS